jgi:hypothetical protein
VRWEHVNLQERSRNRIDPKTAAKLGGWKNMRAFMETYAHAIDDITLNERAFDTTLTQSKPANSVP